jgi:hypothetical protein
VTADTTHAVLGEHTSRNLLYVALTRGRDTNTAYLYDRRAGETDHEHAQEPGVHVARRGTSRDAAHLVRALIANHDTQAHTAHDVAAQTQDQEQLPERVRGLLQRRTHLVHTRQIAYRHWHDQRQHLIAEQQRWIDQHLHRNRNQGIDRSDGLEL